MDFHDWLNEYYEELDNLYNDTMFFINNGLKEKGILNLATKEDFFIFIYQNTRN
jgi:hypothetical protein